MPRNVKSTVLPKEHYLHFCINYLHVFMLYFPMRNTYYRNRNMIYSQENIRIEAVVLFSIWLFVYKKLIDIENKILTAWFIYLNITDVSIVFEWNMCMLEHENYEHWRWNDDLNKFRIKSCQGLILMITKTAVIFELVDFKKCKI